MSRRHHQSKDHYQKRRGTKYVKKDTLNNDNCYEKGTRENPFISLLEAELDGKWKELVVLASVPCYGPLDGGLKLEDGQKLVGEGTDPTAVGNVNKAWITNTTDRLDGAVLVTEGDNEVNNLLIGEDVKEIKGDVIINANKSANLTLCNLKIIDKKENREDKTVLKSTNNDKDGSIFLNCVNSTAVRATGIKLSSKGKSVKYLCVSNTIFKNNDKAISVIATEKSEISIRLDKVKLGSDRSGGDVFLITENEGSIPEMIINESAIFSINSIIYQSKFRSKCNKTKAKLIITKSVTGTIVFELTGKADVLFTLKDNNIFAGLRDLGLLLYSGKDINLQGFIKRNIISGRSIKLGGNGKMDLKMYDNKITSNKFSPLLIESSDTLKLSIKAQNNTISTTDPDAAAINVGELTYEPILDFGGGKLNSKGHNSILVDDPLTTPNAIINSNGFVAQKNWWGLNGPVVETGTGVSVDVSKPLLKPPQQFCDC